MDSYDRKMCIRDRLRTYRHKAYYSLDRDDGLEHEALFVALSPHELYERKVTMQELHAAIASLPNKQAKRIYAHFILGMTKQDIARAEGVHEMSVNPFCLFVRQTGNRCKMCIRDSNRMVPVRSCGNLSDTGNSRRL